MTHFTIRQHTIARWLQAVMALLVGLTVLAGSAIPAGALQPGQSAEMTAAYAQLLRRRFGIVLADRTGIWTASEAHSILHGLNDLSERFGEIAGGQADATLKALFDGMVFYRDVDSRGYIAYTIAGSVSFYDLWASYDEERRVFYLYHEMGHLLDTRTSVLHLLMGEISNDFASEVGAYTDASGHYQLGGNFPRRAGRPVYHRDDSASEDWAECFATVMKPDYQSAQRNIGAARETAVRQEVSKLAREVRANRFDVE